MQCTEVGTTYFARLAARDARLMATAAGHPEFAPLVEGTPPSGHPLGRPLAAELHALTNPKQWLMALHLTCTYLAAKNIDKARALPQRLGFIGGCVKGFCACCCAPLPT